LGDLSLPALCLLNTLGHRTSQINMSAIYRMLISMLRWLMQNETISYFVVHWVPRKKYKFDIVFYKFHEEDNYRPWRKYALNNASRRYIFSGFTVIIDCKSHFTEKMYCRSRITEIHSASPLNLRVHKYLNTFQGIQPSNCDYLFSYSLQQLIFVSSCSLFFFKLPHLLFSNSFL